MVSQTLEDKLEKFLNEGRRLESKIKQDAQKLLGKK